MESRTLTDAFIADAKNAGYSVEATGRHIDRCSGKLNIVATTDNGRALEMYSIMMRHYPAFPKGTQPDWASPYSEVEFDMVAGKVMYNVTYPNLD